jgi:hypothetical protein
MKERRSRDLDRRWVAVALLTAVVVLIIPVPHAQADAACNARYTISPDGTTVADNDTHLTWQRELNDDDYAWDAAKTYCENLSLSGADDWRLPKVFELQTIVDRSKVDPAINPTAFPGTPNRGFWSSSSFAYDSSNAWYVYFGYGYVNYGVVDAGLRVRCVR